MTQETVSNCPNCNETVTGNFCGNCGASLRQGYCTGCGKDLPAGSKFCVHCGKASSAVATTPAAPGAARPAMSRGMVVAAGVLGLALVAVLVTLAGRNQRPPAQPASLVSGAAASAPLPDISNMSPRERFDRLYNRVMQAAETGNAGEMQQFTPMALMAYEMLSEVDADARYHAALLKLHSGDVAGTLALADSILMETPDHLFGLLIRGTVAKWQDDSAALAEVYAAYDEVYQQEMAAGRPEYQDHLLAVQGFRDEARGEVGSGQ